jgi:hypothetical protein
MTNEQWDTVVQLRNEGYLVIIWTPEELGEDVDLNNAEELITKYGNDLIESTL